MNLLENQMILTLNLIKSYTKLSPASTFKKDTFMFCCVLSNAALSRMRRFVASKNAVEKEWSIIYCSFAFAMFSLAR